jgi:hypothetical protein
VLIGIAGAVIAAAVFVVLTSATGATYHLFPLLIGFVPGGLPRLLSERPLNPREGTIATVAGLAAVGVAWLALVLLDEMPAATLISDQPGGVPGEFVLFGLLGAILGGWWGSRSA